jgi:hypothetical protein
MTTRYNELAAIGSCYDREQSNGYTDILFADPSEEAEWEKVLDNPGRLLYLPHINKTDFLDISNKGKTVSLGGGEEMALPGASGTGGTVLLLRFSPDLLRELLSGALSPLEAAEHHLRRCQRSGSGGHRDRGLVSQCPGLL